MNPIKNQSVRLAPPTHTHAALLKAFFKYDPQVKVGNVKGDSVTIRVSNPIKADALAKIVEADLKWGSLHLSVVVVPPNAKGKALGVAKDVTPEQLVAAALSGNTFYSRTISKKTPVGRLTYVVMDNATVQFANDNIGSPWKLTTITAEDAARRIFRDFGVSFCTEK